MKTIRRTKASTYGDRTFLNHPIILIGIDKNEKILYERAGNGFFSDKGRLEDHYNDGYWTVVD